MSINAVELVVALGIGVAVAALIIGVYLAVTVIVRRGDSRDSGK